MNQDYDAGLSKHKQPVDRVSDEDVVSIVHQASTDNSEEELFAIVDYSSLTETEQESYFAHSSESNSEKPIGEQLLSLWGIGSLLLFLLANTILSWVQWSNSQPSPELISQSSLSILEVPENPQLQTEQKLKVDSLSVVKPPANQIPVNPSLSSAIPKPPSNPVATTQPNNNLTNALLPPSLQPQFVQSTPVPVAQTPVSSQNLATIPINQPNQSLPVVPSVKPVNVESSSSDAEAQRQALLTRERILEQIRQSQQQQTQLGFNHRTRARLQSAQSQEDPSQLVNQLEKLQQQRTNQ